MKRLLVLFLALTLLCGCAAEPPAGTAASTVPQTAPPETNAATEPAPTLDGLSELTADTVLLYRQADFDARQGVLVPLNEVLSAPAEELLPRSHHYDELFSGDAALWLKLLDYALGNGYQGFSVPAGTLPELGSTQRRVLAFLYRVDSGGVLSRTKDGSMTVWINCTRPDTMEKFSMGLAEARRLAAEAPRGDEWETARWIFDWLHDNVVYGERKTYYYKRGWHLHDALIDRDCVCSGYADAMYYLCNLCGVDCLTVCGLAHDPETPGELGDHAWNLVRVYGDWYVCDPTANATAPFSADIPLCFCESAEAMEISFAHRPTGEYDNAELIPACERGFDPASAWNDTPEGALRSWLWYSAYLNCYPSSLLAHSGLWTKQTELRNSVDGTVVVLGIPYGDFAAWIGRYTGEDAAGNFSAVFSETGDGLLSVRMPEPDGVDWGKLDIRSVTENGDGSFTADLGSLSAVFTVSKTDEGLYRIESIQLR